MATAIKEQRFPFGYLRQRADGSFGDPTFGSQHRHRSPWNSISGLMTLVSRAAADIEGAQNGPVRHRDSRGTGGMRLRGHGTGHDGAGLRTVSTTKGRDTSQQ